MSLIIKGMELPQHAAVNGEKDTAYKCVILAHSDNSVELVIDTKFASAYDNEHNVKRYPLVEVQTPHGRLIDAEKLAVKIWTEGHFVTGNDCEIAVDFTQSAPTIIEAEVSE